MKELQELGKRVHRNLRLNEILRINADINYCQITTISGKKVCIAKTLKTYEEHLEFPFFRGSKSCIVNLQYAQNIDFQANTLKLKDGYTLTISRRRKQKLISVFNQLNLTQLS